MKKTHWKDQTWGKNGAELWFLLIFYPIIPIVFCLLVYTLIVEKYSGHWDVVFIVVSVTLYVLDKSIFPLRALPKIRRQLVNVNQEENLWGLQCYFGKEQIFRSDQLKALEKCDFGFWYLRYSYLSDKKDNYCLTTTDGQQFYITGDMPEIESLIAALKSIIKKNHKISLDLTG